MSTRTLITGASSGIGLELARLLAQHKHDLILVARSKGKLHELASEIQKTSGVRVSVIESDLSVPGAAKELHRRCREIHVSPDILINNAGFGDLGPFAQSSAQKIEEMMNVNMVNLTLLCRYFAEEMVQRKSGHIINVASTAAFQPGPFMAVYFATKAYVLSFSEALDEELRPRGVSVTTICPGPTWTGFQKRAQATQTRLLKAPWNMTAKSVALATYQTLQKKPRVYITGLMNRILAVTTRIVPRRWSAKVISLFNRTKK